MLCDEPHIHIYIYNAGEVNLVLKVLQNHLFLMVIDFFHVFALKVNYMTSNCCKVNVYSCLLKKMFSFGGMPSHIHLIWACWNLFIQITVGITQTKGFIHRCTCHTGRAIFLKSLLICSQYMTFLSPLYLNSTLFHLSNDVYYVPHTTDV